MTVAQLVHPFHPVRERARPSEWTLIRAMQHRAARHLGDEGALWGSIGIGWVFALSAFGIMAAAFAA